MRLTFLRASYIFLRQWNRLEEFGMIYSLHSFLPAFPTAFKYSSETMWKERSNGLFVFLRCAPRTGSDPLRVEQWNWYTTLSFRTLFRPSNISLPLRCTKRSHASDGIRENFRYSVEWKNGSSVNVGTWQGPGRPCTVNWDPGELCTKVESRITIGEVSLLRPYFARRFFSSLARPIALAGSRRESRSKEIFRSRDDNFELDSRLRNNKQFLSRRQSLD